MADQWYVGRNGQKAGPYTTEQLKQMAAAGQLVPSDLLWKQGLETWVPLTKVRGLLPAGVGGTLPPLDLPQGNSATGRAPANAFDFPDQAATQPPRGTADWNPYQAAGTAAVGLEGMDRGPMAYAGFLPRVAACLLDWIFIGVIGGVLQFGVILLFAAVSGGDETAVAVGNMIGSLVIFVLQAAYYVGFETSSSQATLGKQIVGIKVTDVDGRRITTGRALGRYFAKIITGLTCGIGYLLPLFTYQKQTLHDLICGCLALKKASSAESVGERRLRQPPE